MSTHHTYQESFSRSRPSENSDPFSMAEGDEADLSWAAEDHHAPASQSEPTHTPKTTHPDQEKHKEEPHSATADVTLPADTKLSSPALAEVQEDEAESESPATDTVAETSTVPGPVPDVSELTVIDKMAFSETNGKHTTAIAAEPPAADAIVDAHDVAETEKDNALEASGLVDDFQAEDLAEATEEPEAPLPSSSAPTEEPKPKEPSPVAENRTEEPIPDPFSDDTGEDWLKAAGIEPPEPSADAKDEPAAPADIEDEWAKALGGDGADGEDAWAALDDELDDDGFLEDDPEPVQAQPTASRKQSYVPAAPSPSIPAFASATPAMATPASYTPQPIAQAQPAKPTNDAPGGKPMKFFEELPMTQPQKARRPKPLPPVAATPPPPATSAPPPATSAPPIRGGPPPPQGQAPPGVSRSISSQYGSFVPGPRLDPFPPEPSVRPRSDAPPAVGAPPAGGPPPSARYSPAAPSMGAQPSKYTAAPSAAKYSPSSTPAQTMEPSKGYSQPPPSTKAAPLAPPPKPNARYSPAPVSAPAPSANKATPAPFTPTGPPSAHRFAPRTSSPLAFAHSAQSEAQAETSVANTGEAALPQQNLETSFAASAPQPTMAAGSPSPPTLQSPIKTNNGVNATPRRSNTQSPEATKSRYAPSLQARSSSVAAFPTPTFAPTSGPAQVRSTSHTQEQPDETYIRPRDEFVNDPLQRWKGAPIFRFGGNGMVVSMLPKAAPRYVAGQAAPMLEPTAGEVKIRKATEFVPSGPNHENFPGPLKAAKSKKKELVAWMAARIETLQKGSEMELLNSSDARSEERILLWQVMKLLVENDGVLSGNAAVDSAVKQLIVPDTDIPGGFSTVPISQESIEAVAVQELTQHLLHGDREKAVWHAVDHKMWAHAMLIASTVNPALWKQVVQEFVKNDVRKLRPGNHSMGALYNVFAGNWDESIEELVPVSARAGFQMMSSSTDGTQQQRNALDGLNQWRETLGMILCNRSNEDEKGILSLGKLLASYGRIEAAHVCFLFARSVTVFGGCDDPNANFALVGTDVKTQSLDLDAVVLSEIYEYALAVSGKGASQIKEIPHLQAYKLRHAYALVEMGSREKATQYCDALAATVSSSSKRSAYYNPALASEIQSLARRLSQMPNESSSSWTSRPSMDKITGKMWSSFNKFVAGDDTDATSNGSSTPADGEVGPFSRVAGGTPTISRPPSRDMYGHGAAAMPAPQWGGTPPVAAPPVPGNSRYAPSAAAAQQRTAIYAGGAPSDSPALHQMPLQPRPASQQSNSSYTPSTYAPDGSRPSPMPDSYVPSIPEESYAAHSPAQSSVDIGSNPYAPSPPMSVQGDEAASKTNGHAPNGFPPRSTSYGAPESSFDAPSGGYQPAEASYGGYQPSYEPTSGGYEGPSYGAPAQDGSTRGYEPSSGGFEPQSDGYEPSGGYDPSGGYQPSSGGYEPPSSGGYVPYEPEADSPDEPKPRKKMFGDDDDDNSSKAQEKARKDREADEAFRRAAEADAKRDEEAKAKRASGGWFGGIWGKKDPSAPVVHKAKLGEENAFVFDPETKRWVNKKAGATQTPAAAPTPPPPMGGPRAAGPPMGGPPVGAPPMGAPPMGAPPMGGAPMNGPPMGGPPSRAATPASTSDAPASLQHIVGGPAAPPSGPPSRPPTSMSGASSIDDLLGPPSGRKGTVKKGKKGGRYVDIMAK